MTSILRERDIYIYIVSYKISYVWSILFVLRSHLGGHTSMDPARLFLGVPLLAWDGNGDDRGLFILAHLEVHG